VTKALLTSTEAAKFLRISKKTLATFRKRGLMGYFRVGGKIFYSQKHLLQLLAQSEEGLTRESRVKTNGQVS
jgi:hypothetical protein